MFDLDAYMDQQRLRVDAALLQQLPPATERPARLHEAMRYSLESGGKRLRPILCLACASLIADDNRPALPPALALEYLHTYTLIHDDLPAMDDDDLRRGRPTLHKVYGEALAILAGDTLLTFAFEILARAVAPPPYPPTQLALELALAAGSRGVAGGQTEDLEAEGRTPDKALLEYIHIHKTAKLIQAACRMGAISVGAPADTLAALSRYGEKIGLAFQAADDILNVTSSPEQLGKAVGSDAKRGKLTYVAVYGLEAARDQAQQLGARALAELAAVPHDTTLLAALARFITDRTK